MTEATGGWHNGQYVTPEQHAAALAAVAKLGLALIPLNGEQRHKDVHTEHCCWMHGCKYDWHQLGECTVEKGAMLWQSFPCERCETQIAEVWELAHLENEMHDVMVELRHARIVVQAARNWASTKGSRTSSGTRDVLMGAVRQYNEWVEAQS